MTEEDAFHKFQAKVSPGYFVRQAEEMLSDLQKENFNLKLKIYFLESQHGISSVVPAEMSNERNYFELLIENDALKKELEEKRQLMSSALEVIELLERQKDEQQKESAAVIEEATRKIEYLKMKSQRKILKKHMSIAKKKEELRCLRNDQHSKSCILQKLSNDKFKLLEKCEETERKLLEKDTAIKSLTDQLNQKSGSCDITNLIEENSLLRHRNDELSIKCCKLERENADFQRIVREQSEIMKALNRTVEAKNDEIDDYRLKIEFNNMPKFIQENEINLNGRNNGRDDAIESKLPFHNPLFGSLHSLF